jgi:hypothetical protein
MAYPFEVRWLLALVAIAIPAIAVARPRVAVAPLDGDSENRIADIVAEAADDHARVVRPEKVSRAMDTLSVDAFTGKTLKRLRINLEVDVVIHGRIEKAGGKRRLSLTISGKGKHEAKLAVAFKSTKTLRKTLSPQLRKKLEQALGGEEDPADDDPPPRKHDDDRGRKHDRDDARKHDDDDRRRKHDDDDRRRKHDDDDRHRRVADDDTRARKHHDADDDDDDDRGGRHRHRHHKQARNALTQAAVWFDGGAEVARRTLTWDGDGTTMPPRVGTAGAAGRIDAELYPGAFSSLEGAGGLGIYGEVSHTVGLGIDVPGTTASTPIKDGHYAVGARYRFAFGSASAAFGASYWRRYYIAERGGLAAGQMLDMPDVDYTAVAPGALVRFAATPTVGGFLAVDVPLILQSGDIQSSTSYGRGTVIAFDVRGGAQIVLGPHYALALAAEFDQIGISFEAAQNSQAQTRGVSAATDRSIGVTATVGIFY